MADVLQKILSHYGINTEALIQTYGTGLINATWKIQYREQEYILQKINDKVFKEPGNIANNIEIITSYLEKNHPDYFFVAPVKAINGERMIHLPGEGYFRLFPFVKDSHTYDITQSPKQAYEAARQFGLLTRMLINFPVQNLKTTLTDFHNLIYRYSQFENAIRRGNPSRIRQAKKPINFLHSQDHIVSTYKKITSTKEFKLRVTHHDTKINNVLFDRNDKGLCVIDLDTLMPGYFISDVGDMMRTYLSPVSEEEKDFNKIEIREDYFKAITQGYLEQMTTELTSEEIDQFVYAGMFMIYMQGIRFLTDYLNNDSYYGASYERHNYVRAKNQAALLEKLLRKENFLNEMVIETVSLLSTSKNKN